MLTGSDEFLTGISALKSFVELSEVVDSVFEDVVSEVDTGKFTKRDQEKGHERA